MANRFQNDPHTTGRVPGYYANNRLFKGSYTRTDWQTRTSRRIHDGFNLQVNYGLDTTSDDVNSSPYSSPYYVNGRYNSDNLVTQRANSASVQGTRFLISKYDETNDFTEGDIQTYLELWQGKQIKFEIPYSGKVVGNTITIRNSGGCTGILSIYLSATDGGKPLMETSVDLCKVSEDKFEHYTLRGITPVKAKANPRGKLYVRMEIWDEIANERSVNPFNTGRKIEIAATGAGNHDECIYELTDKNVPVVNNPYQYVRKPSRPLLGLIYNDWRSIPVDRISNEKTGATVSDKGYRYDIFAIKNSTSAEILIYDKEMNKLIDNNIKVDGRAEMIEIAQVVDTDANNWVYYVDGFSPLQRFKIGEWNSTSFPAGVSELPKLTVDSNTWFNSDLGNASGTFTFTYNNGNWKYNNENKNIANYGLSLDGTPADGATITIVASVVGSVKSLSSFAYVDARPVLGPSHLIHHNNRLYIGGFTYDKSLWQASAITEAGPAYTQFPYRFYTPNNSPYATSINTPTAVVEYTSDQIMILGPNFFSIFQTNVNLEDGTPTQVSSYADSVGVQSQGDVVNYKGTLYSFDLKEGIRQFNGAKWMQLSGTTIDSHYDRVDMTKPRKIWGYANKLYFNYTDKIDGKAKCIIRDFSMNYQQYPWFQDIDLPFCDVRFDETEYLVGIHPDYPCIMNLYAVDTWSRLDSPITFERHTKYLSVPGNMGDLICKRIHNKVIAISNRWWWFGISAD